jgi:hypothetical protein
MTATGRKYGAMAIAATLTAAAREPRARIIVGTQQVNPVRRAGSEARKPLRKPPPLLTDTSNLARAMAAAIFNATRVPRRSDRSRFGTEMNSATEWMG